MRAKAKRRFFKIKALIFLIFCLTLIAVTIYVTLDLSTPDRSYSPLPLHPKDDSTEVIFELEESILVGIKETMELIPLELELTEKLIIDESWGDLGIFKKLQRIHYKGLGIYSVDLSSIDKPTVEINNSSATIVLTVPEPRVKTCTIIEEETLYEDTEKGFLRFGEITLTIEEQLLLTREVTSRMKKRMGAPELLLKAMESTRIMLKTLISPLAEEITDKELEIIIVFQDSSI